MNLKLFYDAIRKHFTLTDENVKGFDFLISQATSKKLLLNDFAYILATVWHETASRMTPIAEYGKGRGRKYGVKGKYNQIPYGRGYVQLTWDYNYEKADKELNLNGSLLKNFDLALDPKIASLILFKGMEEGWFTGKKLRDFIDTIDESDTLDEKEYEEGRRVINGVDRKQLIASYAVYFEQALKNGGYGLFASQEATQPIPVVPSAVVPETPKPSVQPSTGILEGIIKILIAIFGGKK